MAVELTKVPERDVWFVMLQVNTGLGVLKFSSFMYCANASIMKHNYRYVVFTSAHFSNNVPRENCPIALLEQQF
jgi:hypothetical protein